MTTTTIIYNIYIIYNSKYYLQEVITVYDLLNKKLSTEETEDKTVLKISKRKLKKLAY